MLSANKIIVAVLLSAPLFAQPSPNSVSQQVLSNSTIATTSMVIGSQYNIGQNSHQLYLYTTDAAGGSGCAGFNGVASLGGSIDGTVYKQISTSLYQPLSLSTDAQPYVAFAAGV